MAQRCSLSSTYPCTHFTIHANKNAAVFYMFSMPDEVSAILAEHETGGDACTHSITGIKIPNTSLNPSPHTPHPT